MFIQTYKIKNSDFKYIIHTRSFINDYPSNLKYDEEKEGDHNIFTIVFSNDYERTKFTNELRESIGLEPF